MSLALDGLRILVLEDEAFLGMSLCEAMDAVGATQTTLSLTTADAYLQVLNARFDAAVLDVRLPDGNPYEVAEELLKQGATVIFYTGQDVSDRFLRAHPHCICIRKPAAPEILINAVQVGTGSSKVEQRRSSGLTIPVN